MAKLVFAINGERFEPSTVDPSMTLLEFLRTETRFKGPKLGCGDGGCGACVVLLSKYDALKDQVEDFTVTSCLTLLCSVNFCSITTTEGLGNSKDGFHSIHQRFSGFHASQCGFCTPGMCVSLFSALVNADKKRNSKAPKGFSKLTVSEAEKAIAGNLCRCTGYRPIVDACKSFAMDVDMEDLGLNTFWNKGEENVSKLPFYDPNEICTFPDFLKNEIKSSLINSDYSSMWKLDICRSNEPRNSKPKSWFTPLSIRELCNLLDSTESEDRNRIKMIVGNTGFGVYKELQEYDEYIDLNHIPDLHVFMKNEEGIEIGAAVTISKAMKAMKEEMDRSILPNERLILTKLVDHMSKIASEFVRNTASLGGNLVLAQRNGLPSDIATILLALGSSVKIYTSLESRTLTLEDFFNSPSYDRRTVLTSIWIPTWNSLEKEERLLFETYRASPRPLGNAVSYINSAFLGHVSRRKSTVVLKDLRLAFGAYSTKHAIRAKRVEEFLVEKSITPSVLLESMRLLQEIIQPEDGKSNPNYASSLSVGFLFDFLRSLVTETKESIDNIFIKSSQKKNDLKNGLHSVLVLGNQTIEFGNDYYPVGQPTKKTGAEIQASGEAVYVDDIPSANNCLHGAFIYSTKPFAKIKSIECKNISESPHVIALITAKDIPQGGENVGSSTIFGYEPLFAENLTVCAGQPLALVIADTQRKATIAAQQASVHYDTENVDAPILSIQDAVERSNFFPIPSFVDPKCVGDFSHGMAEAEHQIVSEIKLGSQYYFYLETQTALAIPDEDNCMVVYSSTQCPENTQNVIAKCLGIPNHNVRVLTRRVGGGFGGKATRSIPIATACALAAHKLCRPVRIYLDRKTDMIMAGGRHPMNINYTVGFKSDGKITALHVKLHINAGIFEDISPVMPLNFVGSLKKYNWGSLSFDIKVCRTNSSSKSAMRAPGEIQGSFVAETVIEHVASKLSKNVDVVRLKNLHTYESLKLFYQSGVGEPLEYTLPLVLDKLVVSSSFHNRTEMIKEFNKHNIWKKRGISRVPIVHEVCLRPTPGKVSILQDGSIVVEVGGVEVGQGLWTKVKQMTAFALGKLLSNEIQNNNLLERIRIVQADTLSMVQGGFTAGSTTSEASCEAVRISCCILVERLMPLKKTLQNNMDSLTWDVLISKACLQAIDLTASTLWAPDYRSMHYLNFGAAVSEVEIDLLTGSTTILQTDIIYDCGKSLNPAVDLGQVEGAFVQGVGFLMLEEYLTNSEGLAISEGTWNYKIPTIDTIPKQFNVELMNSGHHQKRVLSSKASGEPPLLLSISVYCAVKDAVKEARKQYNLHCRSDKLSPTFHMEVPATMPVIRQLCGLDNVEKFLENMLLQR